MDKRKFFIDFDNTVDHSIDYLMGMLSDSRITTLTTIKDMTIEKLDRQFRPGWNTIRSLLSHIIALEHYFRIEFVEGRKLTVEEEKKWLPALNLGQHIPELIRSLPIEFYLSAFAESRSFFLESFKKIDFDSFTRRIEGYDPQEGVI